MDHHRHHQQGEGRNHDLKVDTNSVEFTGSVESSSPVVGTPALARQASATKSTCLCSPTTHAGSFRCRLHRTSGPALQRTKSMDSASH
ncbi:hypothetical protein SAY87_016887 [Trapa incisa]|uniref:Uncharacterized protein n=2 Tax=Trapa TaxID=22665 RepID=A0AAN7R825_TRANT|nr:hypothetical protein SAY87_016887 [Trapa incisa]KAK4790801.1 hypothetical protein SAY86_031214 [Trapa natans]